ncbi:MAG: YhbY family RNA-binding protein [Methanobacteriota archaeon]|nr:MAG: YhbY family RNA-binding protein [Euryarchaeota archaeon]
MTERRGDRELRAEAQSLRPTVLVGRDGVTEEVVSEVTRQLKAREVVKVRLPETPSGDRKALARGLAERASARLVEVRGRTAVLCRERSSIKGCDEE